VSVWISRRVGVQQRVFTIGSTITNASCYSVKLYGLLMSTHQDPLDEKFSGYTAESAYIT
jgi:hypothetical protein